MSRRAAPQRHEETLEASDSREKVIVRSNGTVTYVGKDIAYQFWKFGLLGRDFSTGRLRHAPTGRRCGRRRATVAGGDGRRPRSSAARQPRTTSSTCASRTCRSC